MGLVGLKLDGKRPFTSPVPSINREVMLKIAEGKLPSESVLRLKKSLSNFNLAGLMILLMSLRS